MVSNVPAVADSLFHNHGAEYTATCYIQLVA